ncbi:MAG: DNA polymerase I [Candidatus Melainabacteria bacterium]|nr:DNA polymerase I [Candidatus Melainabacteria bacterium]
MADMETLVLVDGSSLAFRSFYALFTSGLRTKTGVPTWAILGFFNSFFDLIERQHPDKIAVCFDTSTPTFRHTQFDGYKANRLDMPAELAIQWPLIKKGIEVLGVPVLELPGFEADDIIGTLAKRYCDAGKRVVVLTGDQDIFQLVDTTCGSVEVLMPGKTGLKLYQRAEVHEKLGVWPEQIIDYKGLCGDTSDCIPGIRGIGPKTAQKLLTDFGSIDGIYDNIDKITAKALNEKLRTGKDVAYMSRNLATIDLNVPLDLKGGELIMHEPDINQAGRYFKSLAFKSLVQRIPRALVKLASIPVEENGALELKYIEALNNIDVPPITPQEVGMIDDGDGPPHTTKIEKDRQLTLEPPSSGGAVAVAEAVEVVTEVLLIKELPNAPRLEQISNPRIISKPQDLQELVKKLAALKEFSLNLETTSAESLNTSIVGISLAWLENEGPKSDTVDTAYIPLGHQTISAIGQMDHDEALAILKPLLESKEVGKVAYNAKFEQNVFSLYDIEFAPVSFDPMLASYIINPDNKHGLKEQADRVFNHQMVPQLDILGKGKSQVTVDQVPIERLATYACDDARVSLELARYYSLIMDEEQNYLLHEMEIPLSAVLSRVEQNGVALDLEYLSAFSKELSSELSRLEGEIYALADGAFNIGSPQQLQKILFEKLGLKSSVKTKTGFSTDASVLEGLINEHPIISKILEYRHMSKLKSTYVDSFPKQVLERDHRLHGEFNQTVASTGRLSSSNPNLQNIPIRTELGRRIRRSFVAGDKNSSLISADYSQIELRMLGHMSSDEILIDAFEKDQDIHSRTAMEIFDAAEIDVTSDMRGTGKTLNFALVYQQGAFATAQSLGISNKEAQAFIDKYFSRYPRVKDFLSKTIEEARRNGFVTTLWGRKRYFQRLNDPNNMLRRQDERAACNAPIQGSAADLIKLAMIELDRRLRESSLKAKLILQVHDELVLEVPDSEIDEVKKLVVDCMQMNQPLKVPLKVDIHSGKNWMEAK